MATIKSVVCGNDSNSYLSYAELEDRLSIYDWWEALTPTRKANAAILAAAALDSVPYYGQKLLIGQRMQFPRNTHPVITINYPFLKEETNYSATLFNVEVATTSFSGKIDLFPTSLEITYIVSGISYTATMAADGSIYGTYCSGFCNKDTGELSLTFTTSPDIGTSVTYSGSGQSRIKIVSGALKGDIERFANDFLKYGSVRLISDNNEPIHIINSNNPYSGEVVIEEGFSTKPSVDSKVQVISPILEDIKTAQLIQTVHIIDKKAISPIEGVRMVKIGDSVITFSDKQLSYSKYVRMASRYGIHPAAFVFLVPYTIYAAPLELARS